MKPVSMHRNKIAGIALLAASILAVNAFSQSPDPNFYIFLAFGQSNMEGYPNTQQAQDSANVPARFRLLPAVTWPDKSRTQGTWTAAIPPLCRNTTGLCPCDYFGRTLVDSLPATIKIGIVNVSVAGCAIEMFDKDKYQSYVSGQASWMKDIANLYGGNPYARLVAMGLAAQKDGVIKGFLLHQGESGSSTNQWANEVKLIYNNLITDLSLDASKTPLIAGDLASPSTTIQGLPKVLANSHVVSSQGIQVGASPHFSSKGYRDFGKRYADTMLHILHKQVAIRAAEGSRTTAGYALGNSVEFKNGMASVSFEIPLRTFVTLKAYTLSGKEIAELAGAEYSAGKHTLEFGRKAMPTGVFVLKMKSGTFSATRTIMVGAK
jgi:hypothetical protein